MKKKLLPHLMLFFPFVDGIEKLIQSGVSAVIQPRGSIRDKEIIKFADKTNTILIFLKQDILDIKSCQSLKLR